MDQWRHRTSALITLTLIILVQTSFISASLIRQFSAASRQTKKNTLFDWNQQKSPLVPEYVQDHWQEDELFSHQFLNGVNPIVIRRCSALPANLPVTSNMVFPGGEFTLDGELKVMTDCLHALSACPINFSEHSCLMTVVHTERQHFPVWLQVSRWRGNKHPQREKAVLDGPACTSASQTRQRAYAHCYSGTIIKLSWTFTYHTVGMFTAWCSSSSRSKCSIFFNSKVVSISLCKEWYRNVRRTGLSEGKKYSIKLFITKIYFS